AAGKPRHDRQRHRAQLSCRSSSKRRGCMTETYWLILRILFGHPFRIAEDIEHLGITAYCPKFKIKRPHVFHRRQTVEVTKPLFPGYIFVSEPFDVDRINFTPIRTKLMCRDGKFLMASPQEMQRIRQVEMETEAERQIEEMVRMLATV